MNDSLLLKIFAEYIVYRVDFGCLCTEYTEEDNICPDCLAHDYLSGLKNAK